MAAKLVRHHDEEQMAHQNDRSRAGDLITGGDDPLLAALIGKLPAIGAEFPAAARRQWLDMMAMAFDVAYGAVDDRPYGGEPTMTVVVPGPKPAAAAPAAPRPAHAGHDYYIALDGTACQADGTPALITDIPPSEMIFDYRPVTGDFRDTAAITWADGQRGITRVAAGVSFCGPG